MARFFLFTSACVLLSPALAVDMSMTSSLTFDAAAAKNRPVSKVITLLKDIIKQMEKEKELDEETYDKLACWCETNDKEKTKAIKDAETRIEVLETKIAEDTALSARLNEEIEKTKEEVAANEKALSEATALREKEIAEFEAEEKSLLEAISALEAAVEVLSKHHREEDASLLQVPSSRVNEVAMTLQHLLQQHSEKLKGVLAPSQLRAATAFIQAPADYFDAAPTFKQSYAPQSGEIFGVLTQMKEEFEKDLKDAQDKETRAQKAYEELKAAKEAEIAAGKAQIETKTQELAECDERIAHNQEDLDNTKASLSADEQFLMMLKEKCTMTDKEWEERSKTRALEMEAVSKALAILSGDNAHDLFTRTFNPTSTQSGATFLQSKTAAHSERRTQASKVLTDAAEKFNSPRLSALAVRVRLDAFERVKKAIDDMIAALLKEKADEIKHKDFCIDELNENQLQTEKKERDKSDTELNISELEAKIKKLSEEIEALKAEIAEMQVQLKTAGETRDKENKDFQLTVADQRQTQKLLKAALSVLAEFYGEEAAAAFVQRQEPVGPPPPPGFEEYKKSAASGGVMKMITQVIEDAKAMEVAALKAEEDAQAAYTAFVQETTTSIHTKDKEIMNKEAEKAKTEEELVKEKEILEGILVELEQLSNYNAQLHTSCDFVLKNFDLRQAARDEEVEALKQAKAILSGSKFAEFLQRG